MFHAILGLSLKKLHRSLRPLKDLNELIINQPLTLSILYCADDSYLLYFSEKISIPVALWTKNIEANFSSSHFASNLNPFSTKLSTSVYMIRTVFEKQVFGQKVTPMPAYVDHIFVILIANTADTARSEFTISAQQTRTIIFFLEFGNDTREITKVSFICLFGLPSERVSLQNSLPEKCDENNVTTTTIKCLQRLKERMKKYQTTNRTQLFFSFTKSGFLMKFLDRFIDEKNSKSSFASLFNTSWSFHENILYELYRPDLSLLGKNNCQDLDKANTNDSYTRYLYGSLHIKEEEMGKTMKRFALKYETQNVQMILVGSKSLNFLTCSQVGHRISLVIYFSAFDWPTWLLTLAAFVFVCSSISLVRILQHEIFSQCGLGATFLWVLSPLLNVSTELANNDKNEMKYQVFWKICIPLWLLFGLLISAYYQNIVIAHVISPLKMESPWTQAGVEDLRGLQLYTPHADSSYRLYCRGNKSKFEIYEQGEYYTASWKGSNKYNSKRIAVPKKSSLGMAPFDPKIMYSWGCSEFGDSIFTHWKYFCNVSKVKNSITVQPHCIAKSQTLRSLNIFEWSNVTEFLTEITRDCGEQNRAAYLDDSEHVQMVWNKLKQGRENKFFKGNVQSKSTKEFTQNRAWTFSQYTDQPNLYAKRLQNLMESGIYHFLKSMWTKTSNERKIREIYGNLTLLGLLNAENNAQGLNSNLGSIFYIYCGAVVISWISMLIEFIAYKSVSFF